MREERGRRGRREKKGDISFKYLLYLSGGVLFILVVTFIVTFISYNNKLKSSAEQFIGLENISGIVPNGGNDIMSSNILTTQASSEIGKTINEAINSMESSNTTNTATSTNTTTSSIPKSNTGETNATPEPPKDPEFVKPVDGDVIRAFAKDNLLFSDTLQEWVTHPGIDIKADRTTVVKAAETGTVSAIKNDPRYGLTVIIDHVNGFQTVYSNLLSAEFVKQGDKVEKGQSIGTVGNSAAFEIVDPPHLHFEILKDGTPMDPTIYIQ